MQFCLSIVRPLSTCCLPIAYLLSIACQLSSDFIPRCWHCLPIACPLSIHCLALDLAALQDRYLKFARALGMENQLVLCEVMFRIDSTRVSCAKTAVAIAKSLGTAMLSRSQETEGLLSLSIDTHAATELCNASRFCSDFESFIMTFDFDQAGLPSETAEQRKCFQRDIQGVVAKLRVMEIRVSELWWENVLRVKKALTDLFVPEEIWQALMLSYDEALTREHMLDRPELDGLISCVSCTQKHRNRVAFSLAPSI